MEYIKISIMIIFTILIIYIINAYFDYNFKSRNNEDIKFNISSDYIIILSKQNCPYCKELEEKIAESNEKYTIIKLTTENTFEFDNTFTNLDSEERDNIIKEIHHHLFTPGKYILFPTIITKDNIYTGLPKKEIISKIFNI